MTPPGAISKPFSLRARVRILIYNPEDPHFRPKIVLTFGKKDRNRAQKC